MGQIRKTVCEGADGFLLVLSKVGGLYTIKNVTISWCEFGLPTDENPEPGSMMYDTIMYMESLYQSGQCATDGRYYQMRQAGATPNMIMAYEAVHSKVHLLGGGDKDYKDDEILGIANGNQNFRLTLAYNHYTNIMQRVPLVRQGTAHMINCYIDDSGHAKYAQDYSSQVSAGNMNLYRAINPRAGACIAADTCVFNYINDPIIGVEKTCDDSLFSEPWNTLFSEMYNNVLIVNSKTTNTKGVTYTGSSWDNNGDNQFTKNYKWHDKSTLGNWAWSSYIVDVDQYSRQNYPGKDGSEVTPFEIGYNYDEKLPYAYTCLPLESVEDTVSAYSGAGKVNLSAKEWLKTEYISSGNNDTTTEPSTLAGDINADSKVDGSDVRLLQDYLLCRITTLPNALAGDVVQDDMLDSFDLAMLRCMVGSKANIDYQLSLEPEGMEQIDADADREVETITLTLDTSSDFTLHVNIGYWAAWCNIQCQNGTLSWADDSQNVDSVSINGNTVTIKLADGVCADNVNNTSNTTQMGYYGKISLHHNSGTDSIGVISYDVTLGDTVTSTTPTEPEQSDNALIDMSELEGWAATAGYGRSGVTGGGDAEPQYVSTLAEIEAIAGDDTPRVIVIEGTIECGSSGITVGSNKTIVGADENAAVHGGFYIQSESNIIISNLTLHGFYPNSGPDDCISARNVQHLWLNHLTLHDAGDGLMDITVGFDLVTVSWCKFYYDDLSNGHRLCSLTGSGTGHDDTDMGKLNVTYHHNWFANGVDQRMPRILYGQGHVYNNYYTASGNLYCVGVGCYGSVLIEGNSFNNVNNPHQFMYTHALPCYITARNNAYNNTTGTKDTGLGGGTYGTVEAFTNPPYSYTLDNAADVPTIVQNGAGPQ